jgi:hypothetical protein
MTVGLKRFLFSIKWITMSQRKRYAYLWARGGSLRSHPRVPLDDVESSVV